MISDEQRRVLSDLAMRALDILDRAGDDVDLGDAVLVFEMVTPSHNQIWTRATTDRNSVVVGLLEMAKNLECQGTPIDEDGDGEADADQA